VRRATEIAKQRAPDLNVDGEIQLAAARDSALRNRFFPFCTLTQDTNVLVFPDLQSGILALQALQQMGDAVAIGPVLMGTRRPVHIVQYGFSVEDAVNLATVGAVEAAS
jgi:malate dehydrogenase (oxaloacetate-decarboxylating)(NADP+)